ESFFRFLVFNPFADCPHGERGWPPDAFPSPPPIGWSTGFFATPRVCGRLPFQRLRPAFPILVLKCSVLLVVPTVAKQVPKTIRISPDGSFTVTYLSVFAINWPTVPALLQSCAPFPGCNSIL